MDRRRGSPPHRGDDRRFHGGGTDRFRRRSRSPPGYRRSPPPPSKRFRREDDFQDHGAPDARHAQPTPGQPKQPINFRQFMAQLPDSVTPDGAKAEYDRYLADFWGNELRAEFEQKKADPELRKLYDPREIAPLVDARNAAVREAAAKLAEGAAPDADLCPPGPLGLAPEALPEAGGGAAMGAAAPKAPAIAWEDGVVAADLPLARRLARTLDGERGVVDNPLVPSLTAVINAGEEEPSGEEKEERLKAAEAAEEEADVVLGAKGRVEALDSLLRYLWVVHGVDYYGGKEFGGPDDQARATARRTVRPEERPGVEGAPAATAAAPTASGGGDADAAEGTAAAAAAASSGGEGEEPKEGEGAAADGDAAAPTAAAAAGGGVAATSLVTPVDLERARRVYDDRVVKRWRERCEGGDPLGRLLQVDRMEHEIDEFIDRQVIKHDDKKWGNRLSQKMFVSREFVLKHIRNKHGHVVEEQRERIRDDIFFDNFRSAREEEKKSYGAGGAGRFGFDGGRGHMGGGRMGGGRGGRGVPRGGGQMMVGGGPMMVMDPSMMGMMGGPVIIPAGGGMGPMIMAPMGMEMMMGMGGGGRGGRGMRGGRGGRGGGRGGFAGPLMVGAAAPDAQYYDLDAPRNNRQVLDYGDL